jgi:Cft2 family RNA processing exonuclease
MSGLRPAGASGAHVNPIRYHLLNTRGKYGVQDEKKWCLKTVFQRSKVIVSENSRKTHEKSGR